MRFFPAFLLVVLLGCGAASQEPSVASQPGAADSLRFVGNVKTGAQVLAERGFDILQGKNVGLIVNHTARVDTAHLIDVMHAAPEVKVAALFGPEHGLRGTADAGEKIDDGRDDRTGAPVYSLYGKTRKPTPAMLRGLDVLVYDIQDVGARFYTFISTMGLAMQAAAEQGVPFVVLDRPNPLGGVYVSGFVMEPPHESFVGLYPIPVAHGLTVGELALLIKGEGLLPGLENLQLEIVEMEGWERALLWPDTGLPWTPPSPNIPTVATALVYPGTCFFEALSASEGRGTRSPFEQVGAPWADAERLAAALNERGLPGVRFEPARFTPQSIEGMSSNPKLEGKALQGVRLALTDASAFMPVETGIHVLHAFYTQAPPGHDLVARPEWLAKLSGTQRLEAMLRAGKTPEAIIAAWQEEVAAFEARRQPYLRYR